MMPTCFQSVVSTDVVVVARRVHADQLMFFFFFKKKQDLTTFHLKLELTVDFTFHAPALLLKSQERPHAELAQSDDKESAIAFRVFPSCPRWSLANVSCRGSPAFQIFYFLFFLLKHN